MAGQWRIWREGRPWLRRCQRRCFRDKSWTASAAAHTPCAVVHLMEPGVSQSQSLRVGSSLAKVEPHPIQTTERPSALTQVHPAYRPTPGLHRLPGRPRDRASKTPCAPESSSGARSWLCSAPLCQLGTSTVACLATASSHRL